MLSRLALRSVALPKPVFTAVVQNVHTSATNKQAETPAPTEGVRDRVNFPRTKQVEYAPKVRFFFLPDRWFNNFYDKTGVTGPYMLTIGITTFLLSKELWVLDHEFYSGVSIFMVIGGIHFWFGDRIAAFLDKGVDRENEKKKAYFDALVNEPQHKIEALEFEKKFLGGYDEIHRIAIENIGLQLEGEYRKRLVDVHAEVKKRLDYQLEIDNVTKRVEQGHMVNWIVDAVKKAITPQQEAAVMKKCFADLKALAPTA